MEIIKYSIEIENSLPVMVREETATYDTAAFSSPKEIADMLNTVFRLGNKAEEHVYLIGLNVKNQLVGVFEVSHGAVSMSQCNNREIFLRLLLCNAASFILAHNHPSGCEKPSNADIKVAEEVLHASQLMGVTFLDNLIVAKGAYFSFKENGRL